MEITFTGKRVLITGASRGIGKSIAIRLANNGADVIAVAAHLPQLEILKEQQPNIQILQCDFSNWKETEKALQSIGDVDLCVNNAAVSIPIPLDEISEEDIHKTFGINVAAVIHCTQYVSRSLKARKLPGAIVNLSSQASTAGLLHYGVYCASKAAVDGFTRAAALELGPSGIRVNCVNPTATLTERGKKFWTEETCARLNINKIPLQRLAEVSEVVDAVIYLLSDKSTMITGSCLPVDGGFLAI